MYLERKLTQETTIKVINAIAKEASITVLKRGFPSDFVIMWLVVTLRQVYRANLKISEDRLKTELVQALSNINGWDKDS